MRRQTKFRLSCATVLALSLTTLAAAQSPSTETAAVDDLKAPPSPAFVLLGVAPSKVERPQAVRPLVISALSAVSSEGFPRNYAVEFAPYWLGTPTLSFDDYYSSGVLKAIPRHLSLSVATTPLGSSADAGTALGLGVRTLPVPGQSHPKLQALRKRLFDLQKATIDEDGFFGRRQRLILLLQEAQGNTVADTKEELTTTPFETLIDRMIFLDIEIEKAVIDLEQAIPAELEEVKSLPPDPQKAAEPKLQAQQIKRKTELADYRKEREGLGARMAAAVKESNVPENVAREKQFEILVDRYDKEQRARAAARASQMRTTALAIQELDTQRVGPLLAAAGGVAWDIPANQTQLTSLAKVGLWVTPGYRIVRCTGPENDPTCSTSVDVLGVLRYLDDRRSGREGKTWEGGARLIWQARTKLAVSAEWLGRSGDDDPGYRLVGVAEYEINDSAFLYASFGRDFEEKGTRRNLVSTIGLTLGLGKKPIITN